MEGQLGLYELSVISWVSAFQGCQLIKPGSTVLTMGTLEVWSYNIHLHHYIYVTHGQVI